jgi:tetratricopeptide (TPR) repeat protein
VNNSSKQSAIRMLSAAFSACLVFGPLCLAQGTNPNKVADQEAQENQDQQAKQKQLDQSAPPAPKVDPAEEAAYKAFYDAGTGAPDTRIQLGNDFIQKYPMSRYLESVYAGLAQAYYAKQDWTNFYADADKAIAISPDDVNMLTMVGWVIPHRYNPNDPNGDKDLDKAEKYEKHAIDVIGAMAKPASLSDEQFTQSKAAILSEAHSGLGLVYFRRHEMSESVSELQQATQGAANPDQTDYFVLGLDLEGLKRYPEAADAFNHCSQIMGGLQDRCKQSADNAKKEAAQPK